VKRLAQLALELMAPQRILDPLQVLDLPRNLVRRGLERVWDLGCRAGRHLGWDFMGLAQAPAVQAPQTMFPEIPKADPAIEPVIKTPAVPKVAPKIQPKAKSERDSWEL